jgi:hypothetical protein
VIGSVSEKAMSQAKPCWSWTGVAELVFTGQDSHLQRLVAMLPAKKSSDEQILVDLADLGARFHRRLHQDEFGPNRRQQTASLRALMKAARLKFDLSQATGLDFCELWERETGSRVTAHGQFKDVYIGRAETAAGRFVTATVEVMLPDQSWFEDHAEFARSVRAETFRPGCQQDRERQILVIMRDFVKRRPKIQ